VKKQRKLLLLGIGLYFTGLILITLSGFLNYAEILEYRSSFYSSAASFMHPICFNVFQFLQVLVYFYSVLFVGQYEIMTLLIALCACNTLKDLNTHIKECCIKRIQNGTGLRIPVNFQTQTQTNDELWHTHSMEFVDKLPFILHRYGKLKQVLKNFNFMFSWILFVYKIIVLTQLCGACYTSVRQGLITSIPAKQFAIAFAFQTFCYFVKCCVVFSLMGKVRYESAKFVEKINRFYQAATLKEGNRPIIDNEDVVTMYQNCQEIGFRCGSFYMMTPATILSYFSVVTTYLFVILQI